MCVCVCVCVCKRHVGVLAKTFQDPSVIMYVLLQENVTVIYVVSVYTETLQNKSAQHYTF